MAGERTTQSPNVKWQRSELTRQARWESLGHAGATIWFTGLPGAGKSTIAGAVEERLVEAGRPAFLLDGDNLRHGLNGDLGFDEDARCENVRRTAHVARLFAEAGTVALVSLVSPSLTDRKAAEMLHAAHELHFIEVFVDAPLEVCEERDPKGLYARARAGDLPGLTGVGAPYEAPTRPTSCFAPAAPRSTRTLSACSTPLLPGGCGRVAEDRPAGTGSPGVAKLGAFTKSSRPGERV